jgi:hypothetical protein
MEKLDPKPSLVAEPKQSGVQILGTGSRPGVAAPLPEAVELTILTCTKLCRRLTWLRAGCLPRQADGYCCKVPERTQRSSPTPDCLSSRFQLPSSVVRVRPEVLPFPIRQFPVPVNTMQKDVCSGPDPPGERRAMSVAASIALGGERASIALPSCEQPQQMTWTRGC